MTAKKKNASSRRACLRARRMNSGNKARIKQSLRVETIFLTREKADKNVLKRRINLEQFALCIFKESVINISTSDNIILNVQMFILMIT